ncbi:MAG TPA: peptide ligase PGM1-related protein [Acidimicrobiales bacterium]|nr:peptide ligase PGM1-related protein [Acidimicrobiales bacterium]
MPSRRPIASDALPPVWERGTLVLVPSLSFPVSELVKIAGIDHYEERLLCAVLLLDRPDVRLVYLTSRPVDPAVVDYYLSFLDDPVRARNRLHLVAVGEGGPRPLSDKLLGRPDVVARVRQLVAGDASARLLPFNVTHREAELAAALGLALDGPPPEQVALGSKSGSRRVARRAGVAVVAGEEDLRSLPELEGAADRLRRRGARRAVVKLNDGFSGQGNALIDLAGPGGGVEARPTTFCAGEETWASYGPKVAIEGAVVEEVVEAPWASPSVQLRVAPGGAVNVVSSHDQILGGPGGQVYLGCRFPAHPTYREAICRAGRAVGAVLAAEGVIGPFGVDFLVTGDADDFEVFLSEINLRMGGTTHPFWMARLATGGHYDDDRGELVVRGERRCYVATDNLKVPGLAGRSPREAIDAVAGAGLAFDRASGTGVTLHLLGALVGHAKLGATCIAADLEEAEKLLGELDAVLGHLVSRPVP